MPATCWRCSRCWWPARPSERAPTRGAAVPDHDGGDGDARSTSNACARLRGERRAHRHRHAADGRAAAFRARPGLRDRGLAAYTRERQASSRIAIDLAPRHPFQPPLTTVLTPIFHPHVFSSGVVCIGARWLPGEGMDLFVQRVVRLLAFDPLLMNPHSIANAAANIWYRQRVAQASAGVPDRAAALALASKRRRRIGDNPAGTRRRHPRTRDPPVPRCHAALRLPTGRSGTVRCPRCGRDFEAGT